MEDSFYAVDPQLDHLDEWDPQRQDANDEHKPKKKRNRKPVTCAQCRRRKLKCDRNDPCKPCTDRGEEHLCDWSEAKKASPKPSEAGQEMPRVPPGQELRMQLDRLEVIIEHLQAGANNMMAGPSPPPVDPLASLWAGNRVDHQRAGAADALKLLAGAATQVGGADKAPYDAYTPHIEYNSLDELIGALPFQAELDTMIQRFVEAEMVSFPIMVGSDLKRRVEQFDRLAVDTDPCFVALLLAIALFETWYSTTNPKSMVKKDSTIATYLKACRAALELDSYLERPSLDALRTLLILHRFHLFSERASTRVLLAQAFQLAQSLGLDTEQRSGDEPVGTHGMDVQEKRGIWAWMIAEDYCRWSGRHYTISPIHYNTELPANGTAGPTQASFGSNMPGTQETVVQHLLFRSSIAGIARLITDRAYSSQSKPTWAQLCDVERDLRRIENSINATLQVSWGNSGIAVLPQGASALVFDRYIIMLELKQQFIRLFRPFLTRGLRNDTLAAGRSYVIEAARYILAVHRAVSQDQNALRSWLLQHHVLNAMLVLGIEIFQDKGGSSAAACEVELQGSLRIIEDRGKLTALTRDTITIVKRLMAGPKADTETSRKRDRDTFEGTSNLAGDAADLAFLLSGNASGSFAFGGSSTSTAPATTSFDSTSAFNRSVLNTLEPNQPFTKPLPVPMTNDPFVSPASLASSDRGTDPSLETLWVNVLQHKTMYAVPDLKEWQELSKNGSDAWRGGIDILTS